MRWGNVRADGRDMGEMTGEIKRQLSFIYGHFERLTGEMRLFSKNYAIILDQKPLFSK